MFRIINQAKNRVRTRHAIDVGNIATNYINHVIYYFITHKSVVNQKLIEQRRSAYLHALEITQNHPNIPAYCKLAHICGHAYAAIKDAIIFYELLLIGQLNRMSLVPIKPDIKPHIYRKIVMK